METTSMNHGCPSRHPCNLRRQFPLRKFKIIVDFIREDCDNARTSE